MREGRVAERAGNFRAGTVGVNQKFLYFIRFLVEYVFLDMPPGLFVKKVRKVCRRITGIFGNIGKIEPAVKVLVNVIYGVVNDHAV